MKTIINLYLCVHGVFWFTKTVAEVVVDATVPTPLKLHQVGNTTSKTKMSSVPLYTPQIIKRPPILYPIT